MAEMWTELWVSSKAGTLAKWAAVAAAADAARDVERESCSAIQRLFRGQRVRASVTVMRLAAIQIERVHRGHVGRGVAQARLEAWQRTEDEAVYHYFATDCQRAFRGFYSRRYVHDFSARKAYIESVVTTGNALRAALDQQLVDQQEAEHAQEEAARRGQFRKITSHLHHLVSTQSIPGIYNSPYDAEQPICAMGVRVEAHLTSGVKDLLRLKDYTKHPKLEIDLNGTRRGGISFRAHTRRSIQASSSYGAVEDAKRMDAKLARVAFVGSGDMRAGQRVRYAPYKRGLNDGSVYYDPWKNPFLQRGVPRGPDDLDVTVSTIGKPPQVPFYTSVGGNKSACHANTFDVILAAETTGGVTRRQRAIAMGKITRNGDVIDQGHPLYHYPPTNDDSKMIQSSVIHFDDLNSSVDQNSTFTPGPMGRSFVGTPEERQDPAPALVEV